MKFEYFLSIFFITLVSLHCNNKPNNELSTQNNNQTECQCKGEKGDKGDPGSCVSSCPVITSIDKLSGGELSGKLTVPDIAITASINVNVPTDKKLTGTIITRGNYSTSLDGFYCGQTSFTVNGGAYNIDHKLGEAYADKAGIWIAKKHCEQACNHKAAHMCSLNEINLAHSLRGGNGNAVSIEKSNPFVPVPPDGSQGWVLDGMNSCSNLDSNSPTDQGVIFQDQGQDFGGFKRVSCDKTYPIFCCL